MIRLRVSTLEAFRRVVETDYGDEHELIQTVLRGQWADGPSNWKMDAGTAWHACLASPVVPVAGLDRIRADAYQFDSKAIRQADDYTGPGLCEVTASKVYDCWGPLVRVQGTADHVRGLVVQDHKTKFSDSDPGDYEPSLQWRFYLDLFGARVFRYNLWDFKDPDDDGYLRLKGVTSFRFWPYPDMGLELRRWLWEFWDWANCHRLLEYLDERRPAKVAG